MSYLIVLVAVLTRFSPHLPNFSPVFAALLFGGAHLKRRDAFWYPLILLAASDVLLTTLVYHMRMGWGQSITWVAFAAVGLIGYWLRRRETVVRIGVTVLAGPAAFFLISNFGVWSTGHMYPATMNGLITCYVAALPFYGRSALATVGYSVFLFGAHAMYRRRQLALTTTANAS